MAKITLIKRFQYAWYGNCDESLEPCEPYIFDNNLTELKENVEMISSFSVDNANNSVEFFKPDDESGALTQLTCGAMYSVVLKTGKELQIDHLIPAGDDTIENKSKISFDCLREPETTPTPTELVCIPVSSVISKLSMTGPAIQSFQMGGNTQQFGGFQSGDSVGVDTSSLEATDETHSVTVTIPNSTNAIIVLQNKTPKASGNRDLYLHRGSACYAGSYELNGNTWLVNMQLISGEAPTPTPTPEPSNEVDCNCAPENFLTVKSTGTGNTTIENTNIQMSAFTAGSELSFDASTMTGTASVGAAMVRLRLPGGEIVGMLVCSNNSAPTNTQFIVKRGATCYSATATNTNVENGSWDLTLSILKTLSSECGETDPVQTPTPTPTETPTPTPTPTPQEPSECCSSSHTQFTTKAQGEGFQSITRQDSGGGEKQVANFIFTDDFVGSTLCVDLTLPPEDATGNWPEDPNATHSSVFLENTSGTQIGAFLKNVMNDSNSIAFIDTNGVCWTGEYTIGEDLILTQS